jgi:hypothetical protein
MNRLPKLISGNMNIPYIICKPGYAEGSNKPKRVKKTQPKALVIKVRRQEGLVF